MRSAGFAAAGLLACGTLLLVWQLTSRQTQASEIERLLIMPGKVITAHAEFEADCDACHAPLSDQPQRALCIDCHTEIGDDIDTGQGLHGRLRSSGDSECAGCHAEHEGRDVSGVDPNVWSFDHGATDFPLHGAHATVACADCHEPGSRFRDADSNCVDCHRSDDVHAGQLGSECGTCHVAADWNAARFDHAMTSFPLIGAHTRIDCDTCHLSDDFGDVDTTCVSCHRSDDVHRGGNGTACGDCHSAADWSSTTFDHLRLSGFPLRGGHAGLGCRDCHRAPDYRDPGIGNCAGCHADDDPHGGHFSLACGLCHDSGSWQRSDFDHLERTGFPLPDGHADLDCASCHRGPPERALPTDCSGCHAGDDPHGGQLGSRCSGCHFPADWTAQLLFDHDIAGFPLLGSHAGLDCASCHDSAAFLDAGESCIDCHASEDFHRGALGQDCASCHNPSAWRAWQFDHAEASGFPLTGSHAGLACTDCHADAPVDGTRLDSRCSACHSRDDPHRGRFGQRCENCHGTTSFTDVEGMR